ncbi:hypothetical protein VNI00_007181 [Paramarasmius palmivorus]|uniref:Uncharacterized protein n=1 Tax=Paramarasmius palmivorus TaxID=297713 RepID=A0AAW0D3S7_9AGAR
MPLTAAIAPTLVIVRARLGKSVEIIQDISDICFSSKAPARDATVVTLQSQTHGLANLTPTDTQGASEEKIGNASDKGIGL